MDDWSHDELIFKWISVSLECSEGVVSVLLDEMDNLSTRGDEDSCEGGLLLDVERPGFPEPVGDEA